MLRPKEKGSYEHVHLCNIAETLGATKIGRAALGFTKVETKDKTSTQHQRCQESLRPQLLR